MITLYSTNCPKCRVLKSKLDKAGLKYNQNYDVEQILELGFLEAPILKVDNTCYKFAEAVEWVNAQRKD